MKSGPFIALNIFLLLAAVMLGLLGILELGLGAGCYFYGDQTIFCFTPSVVFFSVAAMLVGTSLFMTWRRRAQ